MIFKEELDKRIKDESDIQTRLRYDDELVGEMGYFSCGFADLSDLNNCHYDKLAEIDTGRGDDIFAPLNDDFMYAVFVPEKLLKHIEKKYRTLTSEEFLALYDSGKLHSIRQADVKGRFIITDIYFSDSCGEEEVYVCFDCGDCGYEMEYLLENNFEYLDGDEWKPFGVLDE